jgi:hypothetical protein
MPIVRVKDKVMIEEIKKAVHDAALRKQKMAMFHFQVLRHADKLKNIDSTSFCREIGVPATYKAEFRKMLSLARIMKERDISGEK